MRDYNITCIREDSSRERERERDMKDKHFGAYEGVARGCEPAVCGHDRQVARKFERARAEKSLLTCMRAPAEERMLSSTRVSVCVRLCV